MTQKRLVRTSVGEHAWKNLTLLPSERRALALVKEPLSENAARMLLSADDTLSMMLLRSWVKWEVAEVPFPEPQRELTAMERLQRKMEQQKETPSHQAVSQEAVSQEAVSQEAVSQEASSIDLAEISLSETPSENLLESSLESSSESFSDPQDQNKVPEQEHEQDQNELLLHDELNHGFSPASQTVELSEINEDLTQPSPPPDDRLAFSNPEVIEMPAKVWGLDEKEVASNDIERTSRLEGAEDGEFDVQSISSDDFLLDDASVMVLDEVDVITSFQVVEDEVVEDENAGGVVVEIESAENERIMLEDVESEQESLVSRENASFNATSVLLEEASSLPSDLSSKEDFDKVHDSFQSLPQSFSSPSITSPGRSLTDKLVQLAEKEVEKVVSLPLPQSHSVEEVSSGPAKPTEEEILESLERFKKLFGVPSSKRG